MAEIVMPRLSDSMEEGTILAWMKEVGDEIAVGEEIVEIETDKANMAYESDIAGTLTEIIAPEGTTLPIGEPIAVVGDASARDDGAPSAGPVADEDTSSSRAAGEVPSSAPPAEDTPPADSEAPTAEVGSPAGEAVKADEGSNGGGRIKASPVARRLAKEKGIDLSTIEGSGPGGRVVKKDVKKAAKEAPEEVAAGAVAPTAVPAQEVAGAAAPAPSSPPPAETAKGEVTIEEPNKLQQTVARRMAESKATAPHFYLTAEIDMSAAVSARAAIKGSTPEGELVPSFNDMVIKASAIALREFPKANGAYRDGKFELYSRVNVGVAVAAPGALVVPTVFDADKKGLRQIGADSRALATKVREGTITPPELSGGTFTVSNLGMFGIEQFAAVINAPQAAILAVGAIAERPAVRDGEIVPAHLMKVTLACDHRILYGAEGAELLARIRSLLEEPVGLAL